MLDPHSGCLIPAMAGVSVQGNMTGRKVSMTSFAITPLTGHIGAEVAGLDFREPVDGEIRAALGRAFAEHHVLVMRGQHFAPDQFKAAVGLFGELQPHDKKEHHVPGHHDVSYVSNDEFVNGRRIIPGETFHTDHSNHPRPPKATTLFAVELPSRGGDTQYVNMHDAYDDLPAETKGRIDGLKAVHVYLSKYSPRPLGLLTDESRQKLPPPGIHPLVRTHPENGRKALFLNPVRIESILGMEDDDALQLVGDLMAHATQKKYEYRHQWRHGDWVLWDNRSVMHQANPDYDMNERRFLYRLMLKGEVPE
jgi:taurine dioxygenase